MAAAAGNRSRGDQRAAILTMAAEDKEEAEEGDTTQGTIRRTGGIPVPAHIMGADQEETPTDTDDRPMGYCLGVIVMFCESAGKMILWEAALVVKIDNIMDEGTPFLEAYLCGNVIPLFRNGN